MAATSFGTSSRGATHFDRGRRRAVGAANGANPLSVIVPCHRVVAGDGRLSGYAGGIAAKRWLLDFEGAVSAP